MILAILSQVGLIADIIGAYLLFKYGLPSQMKSEAGPARAVGIAPDELNDIIKHNAYIDKMAKVGLRFLIGGFVLQLIGSFNNY
jgi:hypothetical protein